jgi:hypothetical protein
MTLFHSSRIFQRNRGAGNYLKTVINQINAVQI